MQVVHMQNSYLSCLKYIYVFRGQSPEVASLFTETWQLHSNVCADYTTEGQTPVVLHQRGRHEALDGSKLPGGRNKTLCTG